VKPHRLPLAATLYFVGVATLTSPAEVGPSDLVILVLLYGALAYALAAALRLSSRWGTLPTAACGSAVAGLAVWHFREQVGFPDRSITVLPIAVTLGATAALALRRRAGDVAPKRELATLVAATTAVAVLGAASFELSDLARGGARDVRTWARAHERQSRYASTYLTTRFRWHRPYRIWVAARRLERGRFTLIWSGYGKTWELYDRRSDPELRRNLIEQRPVLRSELEAQMDAAPRAWRGATAEAPTGEREEQLRALGYVK
jgi:hypothetical protein